MSIDDEAAGTADDVSTRAKAAAQEASGPGEVKTQKDHIFQEATERLLKRAEALRMQHMHDHQFRNNVALSFGVLCMIAGGAGFGWFFLMAPRPGLAFACLIAPLILYYFLHSWARIPLKAYFEHHKQVFMPEMAKALGNLRFNPRRGISEKVVQKAGILPGYKTYHAEDCFMGEHKGARMILCEARLSDSKTRTGNVFDGLFVFIEAPHAHFKGHTVITADSGLAERIENQWRNFTPVPLSASPYDHMFHAYAKDATHSREILSDAFLKEFSEMSELFNDTPLSAAFFGGKYLFIVIPYERDMFEPSNALMPVTTKDNALICKREIEQLISIIDIMDLYDTAE